jgi:hypothetical protein
MMAGCNGSFRLGHRLPGRHFNRQIIILCVSWYTSFKLSFRDLVMMMAVPLRNSDQQEAGALKYAAVMCGLDCHAKQVGNKARLGERVVLGDPPHSSLAD